MARRLPFTGAYLALLILIAAACAPAATPSPTSVPPKPPVVAGSPGPSPAAKSASPSPQSSPAAPSPAATGPSPIAKVTVPGFPSKPIEIIVPFAPGGGFDALARQLAVPMERELGQPVIVKNVPGGGTRIAARQMQQAPADGHTIGYFADNGLYTSQLATPPEGFDLNTWVWVAGIRTSPIAIYAAKDSPFKTIEEVIAAERAGQIIRMPHNGLGGGFLVSDVIFARVMNWKNYTLVGGYTGTADLVPAMVRGDVEVAIISPVSSVINFVRSGDLKPLVVLGPERNVLIPDVRTVNEAGLPGAELLNTLVNTYGFAAAPGVPPDRLRALEAAVIRSMQDPGFLAWARQSGAEEDLRPTKGSEMAEIKKREYQLYDRYADEFKKYS